MCSDNAAVFDAVFDGLDKFGFTLSNVVNDKVVVDIRRDLGDEFAADLASGFTPCDFFVFENRCDAFSGHQCGFFVVDDAKQRRQK